MNICKGLLSGDHTQEVSQSVDSEPPRIKTSQNAYVKCIVLKGKAQKSEF